MAVPFLKWAGGKARLVPEIERRLPTSFGRYHEPFLGGGAVFFGLAGLRTLHRPALNDANEALAAVYRVVRDAPDLLLAALEELAGAYLAAPSHERAARYYDVRSQVPADQVAAAARFIFLNRTCYNGLYRVNRSGRFNVPHGRYANPVIANRALLCEASALLAGAAISSLDFEDACNRAQPGDFVYLDPPYHPLSKTSRFTAYTSADFGWPEQERLAAVFRALTGRGVYALLSNSAHPAIASLYEGFELSEVKMSRSINSDPAGRTAIAELLVSNAALVELALAAPFAAESRAATSG